MTKVVYVDKKIDCNHLLGKFLDKSHYTTLFDEDVDVYGPSMDGSMTEENVIAKFRKNKIPKEIQEKTYEGLREAATQSQNRGIAAGPRGDRLLAENRGGRDWVSAYQSEVLEYLTRPLNSLEDRTLESIKKAHAKGSKEEVRGHVWLRSKITAERPEYDGWFDVWLEEIKNLPQPEQKTKAEYVLDNYISETNYAQSVMSGVAGFYGRYPRIPYGRACSFNEKHPDKFAMAFPFLQALSSEFRNLLPVRWKVQYESSLKLDPEFVIPGTVFTTLTVNHNWRTAAHLDAGDLGPGFSNLCGFGKGWKGGELIAPEYGAAFNIQPGDMLFIANHTAIHGNAELFPLDGESEPDRLTVVSYFREDLFDVKSWKYEQLRKQFVDERRLNPDHPLQRKLWNGVSSGMWESDEWLSFLEKHGMVDEDGIVARKATLDSFFG